jgi:hypothetical protein
LRAFCPFAKKTCSGAPCSWLPFPGFVDVALLGSAGDRIAVGVLLGSEQATKAMPATVNAARVCFFI